MSYVLQGGREGRDKFGKGSWKNPLASKTNKESRKNKAFMMVKHKVNRKKGQRSFKDKQVRNILLITV